MEIVDEASLPVSSDDGPANILIEAPRIRKERNDLCETLLEISPQNSTNLLIVTLSRPPDAELALIEDNFSRLPKAIGVIGVASGSEPKKTRSTGISDEIDSSITTIADPRNLTKLGMTITNQLDQWEGSSDQVVVCFDSITDLLSQISTKQTYRFLTTLTGQITNNHGIAHYHLDPTAHDDQEINAMHNLFRIIVTIDESGNCTVRKR